MAILRRHVLAALVAICNVFCYADRTNIGLVILQWPEFSKGQSGIILSSFFYGYLTTQLLGGWIAHKHGARWVLFAGVAFWTFCDLSTVWTKDTGLLWLLILSRVGLGMGEGVNFPAQHAAASKWYPIEERAQLVSFSGGGQDLGTILALLITPTIIASLGWPWVFYVFAILNAAWLVGWYVGGHSSPEEDPRISSEELKYIKQTRRRSSAAVESDQDDDEEGLLVKSERRGKTKETATTLADWTSGGVIAIMVAHFTFNYGWYVMLSWLPTFFKDEFHIDINNGTFSNTLYLVVPYSLGYVGNIGAGVATDYLLSRKYLTLLHARKLAQAFGSFGPCAALLLLAFGSGSFTPLQTSAVLSFGLMTGRAASSGYWTNMLDQRVPASTLMGVSNTIATIPGIAGNILTGAILNSGDDGAKNWGWVWAVGAIVYFVGGVVFVIFAQDNSR